MGKRSTTLYLDDELVILAQSKNINLSRFVTNALEVELSVKELEDAGQQDIVITKLKTNLALLNDELRRSVEEREKVAKKILELTRDLDFKDTELRLKDEKIKVLNEKLKKIKEDEADGFVYPK